jgi:formylglycine-generating enzyme required for sulfatase activity
LRRTRAAALIVLACSACSEELPPLGEVVLHVDTDLPVPQMASRLRVDVFGGDGAWRTSRDIPLPAPTDWPASFGVVSTGEDAPTDALVRLRAYADGRTRDYRGERFHARQPYIEPATAGSLDALCATLPDLAPGVTVTLRRGHEVITDSVASDECPNASGSGTVAARVTITEAGRYRFEVMRDTSAHATLWLRRSCDVESSEVACMDPEEAFPSSTGPVPARLVLDLEPGAYTLLSTTSYIAAAADVALRWTREDQWGEAPPATASPPGPPPLPRLIRDGVDVTPVDEPEPRVTVDRLVRLRLEPGRVAAVHVVLRGACLGTMAALAPQDPVDRVALDAVTTCVTAENERVPPAIEVLADLPSSDPPSLQGAYGADDPCPEDGGGDVVCVPGGVFAFGGNVGALVTLTTLPQRAARISRFWIDRNEVTIGRFRQALAEGLDLPRTPPPDAAGLPYCNWSATPEGKEDHPLACIDHDNARAYCHHRGGELPTEAQWEYVASAAWRPFETRYPWGDARVTCDRAHYGRLLLGGSHECPGDPPGTVPVDTFASTDRTPGPGVANLGGSVQEWTLDSAQGLDHPCWDAASLVDPRCVEITAPEYTVRGAGWATNSPFTFATTRFGVRGPAKIRFGGFRCSYAAPPS